MNDEHKLSEKFIPLRTVLATRQPYTLDDLIRLTGKSKLYIESRLSAWQNRKYSNRDGPIELEVIRVKGVKTWRKIN